MQIKQLDARGKTCPLPVIETKKVLETITDGKVEVLVDNAIAVQNLCKMAEQKNMKAISEKKSEDCYIVTIAVTNQTSDSKQDSPQIACRPDSRAAGTVVVLSSDQMGEGDSTLGRILMKGFVYALTEQDWLPETILLYNSGAKLTIDDAEILTCGTCLNHYGLTERLAVGTVTNMYRIVEILSAAGKVIRP